MTTTETKTTTWAVDPMHSGVQFKVRHLVISTVTGNFNSFEGALTQTSESYEGAEVEFSIDVNSIDTNQKDRDAHLKSDDFFSAEKYPKMTFKGTLSATSENEYTVNGELTIKDVTKPLTLKASYGGTMVDGYGQTKIGFEVEGKLNRKEFGLTWSQLTEAGGAVVGDEVRLLFNIQFTQQ